MAEKDRARYDGPHDEVGLPDLTGPDGRVVFVERGKLLPEWVPVEFRNRLLEQDTWTLVKASSSKPKDDTPAPAPAAPADPSEE